MATVRIITGFVATFHFHKCQTRDIITFSPQSKEQVFTLYALYTQLYTQLQDKPLFLPVVVVRMIRQAGV